MYDLLGLSKQQINQHIIGGLPRRSPCHLCISENATFYYPPEVMRGEYCGVGSIPVAILHRCMLDNALQMHDMHEYS